MPKLTDTLVRNVQVPAGRKDIKMYDDMIRGFGVRVTENGKRSFILNYVASGRERRLTIGQYPAWGVAAAREHAARLRRRVDAGEDPAEERVTDRNLKTLQQLQERYVLEVGGKKASSSQRDERSIWQSHILPELGARRLNDISFSDIERLHHRISDASPIRANRTIALLRHAFNKAQQWGWAASNPVLGIKCNPEQPRERFLTGAELEAFFSVLDRRDESPSLLAIRFIILTGCRKGEAFKLTWDQLDLSTGHWTKPSAHTKQRRVHRIPLSSEATETLHREKRFSSNGVVFPGPSGRPLVDVKKAFRSVTMEANISGLRIHDLRHSYASVLVSNGASLPVIGKLLGHTQAATTMRYAHLFDDPLREASEIMSVVSRKGVR
nr:site-specific integrase [Sphingomonas colocasiae]